MSAAASGGLFGKGAGQGWLGNIFAANTDMVFAMVSEELGLIIALCMMLSILTLAFFAVRSASQGRSAYYAIGACASMAMLLTQMALNVFGSLDLLPFTGVTFPFVSRGGSSLISCWMLMAFIKAADNRKSASFAVRPGKKSKTSEEAEENPYCEYQPYYLHSTAEEAEDMADEENELLDSDFEDLPQYYNPYDNFDDEDDDEGAWS